MMNSTDITTAIENLYTTFGKYTAAGIYHCDCGCIDEEDVKKLGSKTLRKLEEDDLVSYHGSALYTWGDVEHYKHYLPRICELNSISRSFTLVGVGEIFNKLDYAKWIEWPQEEQQAIKDYVLADWVELANHKNTEIADNVLKDYGKFFRIGELVSLWDITASDNSLRNFVFFFYYHGTQILNGGLRIGDIKYEKEFLELIGEDKILHVLEKAFFANEKVDAEYGEKISVVLQMLEQEKRIKSGAV